MIGGKYVLRGRIFLPARENSGNQGGSRVGLAYTSTSLSKRKSAQAVSQQHCPCPPNAAAVRKIQSAKLDDLVKSQKIRF